MPRVLPLLSLTLVLAACGSDPKLSEVQSRIFSPSCTFSSCHMGASPAGALSLEAPVYEKLLVAAAESPGKQLVVPGAPDQSFLMDKLLNRGLPAAPSGETWTSMPPGAMLEQERIDLIQGWIEAGAKND